MNEYVKISHYLTQLILKTAGNKTLLPFEIEDIEKQV